MRIKYRYDGGYLYLYMSGELDEHYAKGAREYIDELCDAKSGLSAVVFNLSELKFMDSTGIGILLGRYKRLKKMGVSSYVESPLPSVEKVLELSGIYEIMPKM